MSMRSVTGHDREGEILLGALKKGKLSSSYLFSGPRGIGKMTMAVEFAKAVNCLQATEPAGDACDTCSACEKADKRIHADLIIVTPSEAQIRIDEIRTVDAALSLKPFEGRSKVVIIDDADTMNISAANAFLKTLEEPPQSSIIILVSANPDRLPDTIRSRCTRINFSPLSRESCREVLKRHLPGEDADYAAGLCMGSPGTVLGPDIRQERARFLSLLKAMLNSEPDSWASREEMSRTFEVLQTVLRDMAVLKTGGAPESAMNSDLIGEILEISTIVDLQGIIGLYDEVTKLGDSMKFNPNKAVIWNYLSSKLREVLQADHA